MNDTAKRPACSHCGGQTFSYSELAGPDATALYAESHLTILSNSEADIFEEIAAIEHAIAVEDQKLQLEVSHRIKAIEDRMESRLQNFADHVSTVFQGEALRSFIADGELSQMQDQQRGKIACEADNERKALLHAYREKLDKLRARIGPKLDSLRERLKDTSRRVVETWTGHLAAIVYCASCNKVVGAITSPRLAATLIEAHEKFNVTLSMVQESLSKVVASLKASEGVLERLLDGTRATLDTLQGVQRSTHQAAKAHEKSNVTLSRVQESLSKMVASLEASQGVLERLLQTYVDGTRATLDTLQGVQRSTHQAAKGVVDTLNTQRSLDNLQDWLQG